MKWIETTLRKGTNSPKICRDMFITDSRGLLNLSVVKNGRQVSREQIDKIDVAMLVINNQLEQRNSSVFNNCSTYRTKNSWSVVDQALSIII